MFLGPMLFLVAARELSINSAKAYAVKRHISSEGK